MLVVTSPTVELSFGGFRLDLGDERLWGPNGPIKLGNKAFRVLVMLAEQEGRLLTKDDLFSSVWDGTIVSEAALTSVIKEIRRALGDESRTPRFVESVYGRGYRFLAEVERTSSSSEPHPIAPERPSRTAARERGSERALLYIPAFDDEAMPEHQRHLSIVLREEIVSALSRFHDIRLVSNAESTGPSGGRIFGDRDYQLSVRLIHDSQAVRAFARIGRLATQDIIWADHMELPSGNLGQSVEQLVRKIVAAALPRLQDDVLKNIPDQPQGLYDQYLINKLKMRSLQSLDEARKLAAAWEELIEKDPNFAQGYAPLIRLYNTDFAYTGFGSSGPEERSRAYDLAHSAVMADPTDSHLHTVKGWCHLWAGEGALARRHLQEALELNPYNNVRLNEVATAMMFLGELDEAWSLLDRCKTLTPFTIEAPNEEEGFFHLLRQDYERAASLLALTQRVHPEDRKAGHFAVMGELYALLAATGLGATDLSERAARWRSSMAERWSRSEGPTDRDLCEWAAFHHPIQDPVQRDHFLSLLETALKSAPRERSRAPEPAQRGRSSVPKQAPGRSSAVPIARS